eukprot:6173364-Pleurochrysis_carterae.AAC.1
MRLLISKQSLRLQAGYMNGATTVSPSYYGEVPTQFWRLSELYQDPLVSALIENGFINNVDLFFCEAIEARGTCLPAEVYGLMICSPQGH